MDRGYCWGMGKGSLSANKGVTMTKCIVCAQRNNDQDIEKAFTCTSCAQFLEQNGLKYNGESIQSYTASFEQVLARDENALFLMEIRNRRQDQQNSVLGAISKVTTQ